MASSRTQRECKALLRDDNYASPPVTAATRSGKVYKTDAPVRLSEPRYYLPAMETDSKVESVTEVAARTASSTASRQTGRSSTSFRHKKCDLKYPDICVSCVLWSEPVYASNL